jgi:SAM-dependent methyltransferase
MSENRQPADFLRELLSTEPLPGRRVLLYGVADARLAVWLAAAGAELAILDPSRDTVLAALRLTREAGVERRVRGVEAPTTDLPMFADLAFDLLVLQPGTPFDLSELARVLRPGARLISLVPLTPPAAYFTELRQLTAPSGLRAPWSRPAPLLWTARRRSDA